MKKIFTFLSTLLLTAALCGQNLTPDEIGPAKVTGVQDELLDRLNMKSANLHDKNTLSNLLLAENDFRIDSTVTEEYDEATGEWFNYSITDYSYEENGTLLIRTGRRWIPDSNAWIYSYQHTERFDDNGNQIEFSQSWWDSEENRWIHTSKTEQSFDDNDNQTLYRSSKWIDSTSTWQVNNLNERVFDANGNLLESVSSYWNSEEQQLILGAKNEFEHDSEGNQILIIQYRWNKDSEEWVEYDKQEFKYNQDHLTEKMEYYYVPDSSKFFLGRKFEFIYDSTGLETRSNEYHYWVLEDSLALQGYTEKFYNENNQLSHYNFYYKPQDSINLIHTFTTELEYDTFGNIVSYVSENWDSSDGSWYVTRKWMSEFDNNGNRTLWEHYSFSNNFDTIVGIEKYERRFDENNNIIFNLGYNWDYTVHDWEENYQQELEYDENGNLKTYISYDFTDGEPVLSSRTTYYYSTNITNINKLETKSVLIYPNPARNSVIIEFSDFNAARVELYTIKGQKVLEKNYNSIKQKLDVSHLNSGLYILKVIQKGNAISRKLIIE